MNRMRVRLHARWIGLPSEMAVFGDRRHELISGVEWIDCHDDEARIWLAGRNAASVEQLCAIAQASIGLQWRY